MKENFQNSLIVFYNEENSNPVIDENIDSETMSLVPDTNINNISSKSKYNARYNTGICRNSKTFDPVRKVLEESTYSIDDVFKTTKQICIWLSYDKTTVETTYESDFSHDGSETK